MKMTNDRDAFYGILGETIDIYQAEHAAAAAFNQLGGRVNTRGNRQKVILGHDAGTASDMMEAAVCAALCAAGADVITLGTVPSGAVSYLTARMDALMGVMITGSSFDYDISGLKFYRSNGKPVIGEQLQSIHASIDSHSTLNSKQAGRIVRADSSIINLYRHHLLEASGYTIFEEQKIVVDCTESASAAFVKDLFEQMGAEVIFMTRSEGDEQTVLPSYANPSSLINFVKDTHSDIGFAFSVNGENVIAADSAGRLLDTEKLASLFGRVYGQLRKGSEESDVIMISDNCHAALAPYIQSMGAECRTVTGGYSYLTEEFVNYDTAEPENGGVLMAADRYAGLVFPRRLSVPDGLLTAVMLLSCLNRMGLKLEELSGEIPKLIRNTSYVMIPYGAFMPTLTSSELKEEIFVLRSYLSGDGRVVLSKPESSKVEIIVEGVKPNQVTKVTEMAERLVRKNLRETGNARVYEQLPYDKDKEKPAAYEEAVDNYVNEAKASI